MDWQTLQDMESYGCRPEGVPSRLEGMPGVIEISTSLRGTGSPEIHTGRVSVAMRSRAVGSQKDSESERHQSTVISVLCNLCKFIRFADLQVIEK